MRITLFERFCQFTSRHFPRLLDSCERRMEGHDKGSPGVGRLRGVSAIFDGSPRAARSNGGKSKPTVKERMEKDLRFLGIRFSAGQVLAAAWVASMTTLLCSISLVSLSFLFGGYVVSLYIAPIAITAPIVAFLGIANYPDIRARSIRIKALGSVPEAVTYMSMSLKLTPSLNKAIEFASENSDEPLAGRLRRVLWDVYSKKEDSIEESFISFVNDWGDWDEDLKRSLFGVLSATSESTEDGLDRCLERAQSTVRTGVKRRMDEYITSLKLPTMTFFTLCVLLPLIVGTTLPILSFGAGGIPSAHLSIVSSSDGLSLPIIILLDVIFPVTAFLYSMMLLARRPGTTGYQPRNVTPRNKAQIHAIAFSLLLASTPLPVILLDIGILRPIVVLWSVILALSAYLLLSFSKTRREQREIRALEQQLPDALFIIGSKLSEHNSVEQALAKASESLQGMEISGFLDRIRFTLQLQRRGLEDTLFGHEGLLRHFPSRTIRVAFKMVVDLSRKDPSSAGRAIADFSHYLRDLQDVEREIKSKLGEIVDTMKSTATFFAPLILGITSALYLLLTKSIGGIGSLPVSADGFIVILGTYLLLMVPIISNYSIGVETGGSRPEFAIFLGKTWPVALMLFSTAVMTSITFLGL